MIDLPYDWLDFEPEPDTTGDGSGDPDKYILTIREGGEEIATIVHRTVNGKYPIDGPLANWKRQNAAKIVYLLNVHASPLPLPTPAPPVGGSDTDYERYIQEHGR